MKTLLALICIALVAVCPTLRAQDAPNRPGFGAGPGGNHPSGHTLENLTDALQLTPFQVAKTKSILKTRHLQMNLNQNSSISEDRKKAKEQKIIETTNEQIKGILTPDQKSKFEEMLQAKGEHHEQGKK